MALATFVQFITQNHFMQLIQLAAFDNFFSANLLLTRLQSDGIDCFLKDENTVTIDPLLSNAIGGIKLMVPENQAQQAIELLQQYRQGYIQQHRCPSCGGNDFEEKVLSSPTNFFMQVLEALQLAGGKKVQTQVICKGCGKEQGAF